MPLDLTVNGVRHSVDVTPDTPLLWVIRDTLKMTGTKFSCGIAQCGACTVHINGTPMRSCSVPVSAAVGKTVTTIEGLSSDGTHPVQQAWIELDVPQCGYCQSGMIMSVVALLKRHPNPTDAGHRRRGHQRLPLQHLSPHPASDPLGRPQSRGRRENLMRNDRNDEPARTDLSRRDVLATAAAATGALVVGFWMPQRAEAQIIHPEGAAWAVEPGMDEVNAWVVVAPDDTCNRCASPRPSSARASGPRTP
jgi:aerobic-type carbon monoxide dehydrogenase small subunit (CoxS/CutS family)